MENTNKTTLSAVKPGKKTHDDFIKEKSNEFLTALLVDKDKKAADEVLKSVTPRGELRLLD